MKIDVALVGDLADSRTRPAALAETGIDGIFTLESNSDPFLPLTGGVGLDIDLYTNLAIALPRSPTHLAYLAWDLHRASAGRFHLGLGTQIKPHIERRFSSTWDRPVDQMVELIAVIRAIWANWSDGTPLDHRGDFYRVDLMTPMYVPRALDHPHPEIWVGAMGSRLTEAMARHADGILIHPFNTGSFLRAHTLPVVNRGLDRAGRTRDELTLTVGRLVAPCLTDEEHDAATAVLRYTVAYFGSTPAYRVTLDHHGLGELQPRLRAMTKSGDWSELCSLIDDDVLDLFATRGTPQEVAARLVEEYAATADRLALTLSNASDESLAAMIDSFGLLSAEAPKGVSP